MCSRVVVLLLPTMWEKPGNIPALVRLLCAYMAKGKQHVLSQLERVTGLINFCDEFDGHPDYGTYGMRQLRLPTLDYCSPTSVGDNTLNTIVDVSGATRAGGPPPD